MFSGPFLVSVFLTRKRFRSLLNQTKSKSIYDDKPDCKGTNWFDVIVSCSLDGLKRIMVNPSLNCWRVPVCIRSPQKNLWVVKPFGTWVLLLMWLFAVLEVPFGDESDQTLFLSYFVCILMGIDNASHLIPIWSKGPLSHMSWRLNIVTVVGNTLMDVIPVEVRWLQNCWLYVLRTCKL